MSYAPAILVHHNPTYEDMMARLNLNVAAAGRRGIAASPRERYTDAFPPVRKATPSEAYLNEAWRSAHGATLKVDDRVRPPGNVLVW